jgi:hypothetical protein
MQATAATRTTTKSNPTNKQQSTNAIEASNESTIKHHREQKATNNQAQRNKSRHGTQNKQ